MSAPRDVSSSVAPGAGIPHQDNGDDGTLDPLLHDWVHDHLPNQDPRPEGETATQAVDGDQAPAPERKRKHAAQKQRIRNRADPINSAYKAKRARAKATRAHREHTRGLLTPSECWELIGGEYKIFNDPLMHYSEWIFSSTGGDVETDFVLARLEGEMYQAMLMYFRRWKVELRQDGYPWLEWRYETRRGYMAELPYDDDVRLIPPYICHPGILEANDRVWANQLILQWCQAGSYGQLWSRYQAQFYQECPKLKILELYK